MQPLNDKQAESVWSRVMNARTDSAEAPLSCTDPAGIPMPISQEPLEQTLIDLIARERGNAALYTALSSRCGKQACAVLQKMARQEWNHADQWQTLYYLLTGQSAVARRDGPAPVSDCAAALRESYRQKLAASERYLQLSEQQPCYAAMFFQTAQEEREQAQQIFRLLQARLRK